jgi:hypothetical protein
MADYDANLIGEVKDVTVKAYIVRDSKYGIDSKTHIEHSLRKLGYLDFHAHLKINQYINDRICKYIQNTIDVVSGNEVDEMKERIKNDNMYKTFLDDLNNTVLRVKDLSKFIGSSDVEAFYNALTLDELNFIGY